MKRGHLEEIEAYFFAQPHVVEAIVNHISGAAKQGVASTYNKSLYLAERRVSLAQWAAHLVGVIELRVLAHHHTPENSGEIVVSCSAERSEGGGRPWRTGCPAR